MKDYLDADKFDFVRFGLLFNCMEDKPNENIFFILKDGLSLNKIADRFLNSKTT